jgi:hypothetical protein
MLIRRRLSISIEFQEAPLVLGHSQDLHETENANAIVTAEDRNKIVKEPRGPSNLRKQQENALEDDEQVVDDSEHRASWLKRYAGEESSLVRKNSTPNMLDQKTYVLFSR